jgi:hypothetical protein
VSISTVGDLIKLALKDAGIVGVGQTPLAEDSNDALSRLNMMVSQWNRRRWLIYHLVDSYIQSTGALSYTVGNGGNFNITRPAKIASAFMRMNPGSSGNPNSASVDYNLDILHAREDWNKIQVKGISSFSKYCFYDAAYPLGNLYFWPVPQSIYEIHISTLDLISQFTGLTQTISLPPEYFEALFYNLIQRLRAAYRLPADEEINGLARAALQTIRTANAQVPRLSMPQDLRQRGRYNIYSDTD